MPSLLLCQAAYIKWHQKKKKKSAFSATIMSIAYGIDIKESEDPYISVAEEAVSQISQAGVPGTFLDRLFSDP